MRTNPKIKSPIEDNNDWGKRWMRNAKPLTEGQKKSISELKRLIKYKYNGNPNFLKASGYNKFRLNNILYGRYEGAKMDQMLNEIVEVISKFDTPVDERKVKIDYDTQVWMKMRLYAKFKNAANFARLYPEFSAPYLNHVMKGRKKYYCPKINRLIQILNSTYEDQ